MLIKSKRRLGILWAVLLMMMAITGVVLAAYLPDGAEIGTYRDRDVDRGFTASTSGTYHFRLFTHIRAWGDHPNPLKDQASRRCDRCLRTNDNEVRVSSMYVLTVTMHQSRKFINWAQYQGYTADIPSYNTHTCWSNGIGPGCP